MILCFFRNGAPEATRTPDPQLRRLLLYPAELRARNGSIIREKKTLGMELLI